MEYFAKWLVDKPFYKQVFYKLYIPRKFRNDKTFVTSPVELNVVIEKNHVNILQSEFEILKLRKNNLLEDIADQDKILEEKLRKRKTSLQVKKEILFYWDCDVTKDGTLKY